jgi:hypothetical protein
MTITIKENLPELPKSFEKVQDLADFIFDYYQNQELPPLSESEIQEAEQARLAWKDNRESFARVVDGK